MFKNLILSSLLGDDLAVLLDNISTKKENTFFPRHHKKSRVVLFRYPRPPFRDKNMRRLRLCGCTFHLKHQYIHRYPYMLETPWYHMPYTDPIISYALYPLPPHLPSIETQYYDACNATPTVSSAVYDFFNTRLFLESYPAASSQTSDNALIARPSPFTAIFIFANRACYGQITRKDAQKR